MKKIKLSKEEVNKISKFMDSNNINEYNHYINDMEIKIKKLKQNKNAFPHWVITLCVSLYLLISQKEYIDGGDINFKILAYLVIILITILANIVLKQIWKIKIHKNKFVTINEKNKKEETYYSSFDVIK